MTDDSSSSGAAPAAPTTASRLEELRRRRAEAAAPMGEARLDKVRDAGRLPARDRIDYLLDEGSFVELDRDARHRLSLIHI